LDRAAQVRLALGAFNTILESIGDFSDEAAAPLATQAPAVVAVEPRPLDKVVGALQGAFAAPVFQGTVAASLVTSALAAAQVNAAVLTANPQVFATDHSALAVGAGTAAVAAAAGVAEAMQLREAAAAAVSQLGELSSSGTHASLQESLQDTLAQTGSLPSSAGSPEGLREFLMGVLAAVADVFHEVAPNLDQEEGPLAQGLKALTDLLSQGARWDLGSLVVAAVGVVALIARALPSDNETQAWGTGTGDIPDRYDVDQIDQYLKKHPLTVLRRTVVVSAQALRVGALLLVDWKTGQWEAKMEERANMALHIIEDLGPSFIKLAQLLSTRVDMMPKPYLAHFSKLQDRVRPFSTAAARDILVAELGCAPEDIFETISSKPVAAASIGQVYRGTLKEEFGGTDVAIKVQRPNILENSSLDLFVIRKILLFIGSLPGETCANIGSMTGILDEWADKFFLEMDYLHEAENSMRFQEDMKELEVVCVPKVYEDLSTKKVLVTEWVIGEKLSESKAEDVKALVTTMLNCYLIQLLETGFLHADPHPGNLIRMPDGRICVLDFGLMGEVTKVQRDTLVEFIAHLSNKDWGNLVQSLNDLGFIPEGAPDPDEAGITHMLGTIMGQIVDGGGAGRISMGTLMTEMEGLAENYPIRVPGYFALVLRAFGVLEGIALKVDPDYSIVSECFPYLSRRLLSDNSEHSKELLKKLLYSESGRLDMRRLQKFAEGFGSYSMATDSGVRGSSRQRRAIPRLDPAVKDAIQLVFSEEDSYVQELLVDELVAAIDALSRDAASEVLRLMIGGAGVTNALAEAKAFGPMTPMMLQPVQYPLDFLTRFAPAIELSEEDDEALDNVHALVDTLPRGRLSLGAVRTGAFLALEIASMAPTVMPGFRKVVGRLITRMSERISQRLVEEEAHRGGSLY